MPPVPSGPVIYREDAGDMGRAGEVCMQIGLPKLGKGPAQGVGVIGSGEVPG